MATSSIRCLLGIATLARVERLAQGDVAGTIHAPVLADRLRFVLDGELAEVERAGPWVFSAAWLAAYEADLRERIAGADPIDPGVPVPADAWADDVLALLPLERRGSKLYLPGAVATLEGREAESAALERELASAGVHATKVSDEEVARFLEASGRLVRLGDGYAIGIDSFDVAKDVLLAECRAAGEISLARFRDLVGTGRRDAQLLLERFDADGLTRRVGDVRVLRRESGRVTTESVRLACREPPATGILRAPSGSAGNRGRRGSWPGPASGS